MTVHLSHGDMATVHLRDREIVRANRRARIRRNEQSPSLGRNPRYRGSVRQADQLDDGQFTHVSHAPIARRAIASQRGAALPNTPNQRHLARIPPHQEGRIAIVMNVEAGSDGRETSQRASVIRKDHAQSKARGRTMFLGRSSRVVLTPRRWCQVRWALLTRPADDGGKKARSPGSAEQPFKPCVGNAGCYPVPPL